MKYCIVFSLVVVFLAGCKDYKPEMERAIKERDSIQMLGMAKDSSINAFIETMNEIEVNLDSITQSQQAIATATGDQVEFSKDIRERIHQNIDIITELLNKNKETLASLNQKLKNSNYNIASLKKMIEKLTADIAAKEQEIALMAEQIGGLTLEIEGLNRSVDSLRVVNTQKENVIDEKTGQLNTAYWTMGTYKQLKETNILNKQGGFLGMGKAKVMRKDFNQDAFNKIDITKTSTIEINHKSPKLITTHPTDSYKLNKNEKGVVTTLEITDPIRFWKASKYLVIVTG